ncbi:hypothetical protein CEN39_18260 [Fischerella thermalis CCMEE 5201]|jgi:hypothetical protein|nr:hypothetical protein CEN39_18260 [Fischerella thermalis CCMEE 5201]
MINDRGKLLAFQINLANLDDRELVPEMVQDLIGKLFYIEVTGCIDFYQCISIKKLYETL